MGGVKGVRQRRKVVEMVRERVLDRLRGVESGPVPEEFAVVKEGMEEDSVESEEVKSEYRPSA